MDVKGTLKSAMKAYPEKKKESKGEPCCDGIKGLISRVFATRNIVHFAHWNTKSFAAHEALGGLYDGIVGKIDEIVEAYQGKYGLIEGATSGMSAVPQDIAGHVEEELEWISSNREGISNGCKPIEALLDELETGYLAALYKLKNLS